MKKNIYSLNLIIFFFALLLCGCKEENKPGDLIYTEQPGVSTVMLERVEGSDPGEVMIRFIPDELTSKTEYALCQEKNRDDFLDGTLSGILEQQGNEEFIHTFSNLTQGDLYVVYARSYDKDGAAGALSTIKIIVPFGSFSFETQFITDRSAAFYMEFSDEYYSFDYALGTETDREAFLNGTLSNIVRRNEMYWCYSTHLDLEPATEYIFFLRGYDRYGAETGLRELSFTTLAAGTGPSVTFTVPDLDIYKGRYLFTPNANCSKIAVAMGDKGAFETQFYGDVFGRGNVMGRMDEWVETESANVTTGGTGPLTIERFNQYLTFGDALDVFVLMYDNEGNAAGVVKFASEPASYVSGEGSAQVTATLGTITASEVTFTVQANSATFGYYYRIMPDYSVEGSSQDDDSIWSMVRSSDFNYLKEGSNPMTTTLALPNNYSGNGYYLMVFPCNANGAEGKGVKLLEKFEAPDA